MNKVFFLVLFVFSLAACGGFEVKDAKFKGPITNNEYEFKDIKVKPKPMEKVDE